MIATKIDSLVERRKSNTKTDNITNSKPERLTANSIQRHRLQNYWHMYMYMLSILEDKGILNDL